MPRSALPENENGETAVPLQLGDWTFNLLGAATGGLSIDVVGTDGSVTGLLALPGQLEGFPITGFWDEAGQKLSMSLASAANPIIQQVFVGYLFTDSVNVLGVTGSVIFTLTGYVENFAPVLNLAPNGPAVTAKRSIFGWYAQIGVD
jgi:hypothetical protein